MYIVHVCVYACYYYHKSPVHCFLPSSNWWRMKTTGMKYEYSSLLLCMVYCVHLMMCDYTRRSSLTSRWRQSQSKTKRSMRLLTRRKSCNKKWERHMSLVRSFEFWALSLDELNSCLLFVLDAFFLLHKVFWSVDCRLWVRRSLR